MTDCAQGLVIKELAVRYQEGRRAWLKLRTRASREAVVGAVSGTLAAPERLILGLPAPDGTLVIAGTTGPLTLAQQRQVSAFLSLPAGEHPWPADLSSHRMGAWGSTRRTPVTRVDPSLVVEIDADTASDALVFRHLVRFVRVRPDVQPQELSEGA